MGLDMYLKAEIYVAGYEHNTGKEKSLYKKLLELSGMSEHVKRSGCNSAELRLTVAYWRKANHIHKWFVDNVQGGVDDCRDACVSYEQLQELVNTCKDILKTIETIEGDVNIGTSYHSDGKIEHHTEKGRVVCQKSIAEKLLPTTNGFFFGGTDYDEFYLKDIENTIKMIEPLLLDESLKSADFYYHSSW
jgi:hypothetical protein